MYRIACAQTASMGLQFWDWLPCALRRAEPAESKLDGDDAKQEEADDAEIDRARSRSRSRSRSRTASVFTVRPVRALTHAHLGPSSLEP